LDGLNSSILLQFTDGYFNDSLQSTIGVDFKIKVMDAAGPDGRKKKVKVTIWDTGMMIMIKLFLKNQTHYHESTLHKFICSPSWPRKVPNVDKFLLSRSTGNYSR
jgi:GTPase SAR1 family protein